MGKHTEGLEQYVASLDNWLTTNAARPPLHELLGKRRGSGTRCAVCSKKIVQTKYGYVHRSGKAADNRHLAQPMSRQ